MRGPVADTTVAVAAPAGAGLELFEQLAVCAAYTSDANTTPQYGHTVSVTVWRSAFQLSVRRISNSVFEIRAPVGHTPMQFPQ